MKQMISTAPLGAHARTQCPRCGRSVWVYTTHAGVQLPLDDAPGPVVIDGHGKAFRTLGHDGYQEHECSLNTGPTQLNEVRADEFLWP